MSRPNGPQFNRYGEPADLPAHKKNIPAYIEYPASAGLGDEENGLISEYELGTAQYKGLTQGGTTHSFLLHDGRYAHISVNDYTPTKRNLVTKGHDVNEPWVNVHDKHDYLLDNIIGEINDPPEDENDPPEDEK